VGQWTYERCSGWAGVVSSVFGSCEYAKNWYFRAVTEWWDK